MLRGIHEGEFIQIPVASLSFSKNKIRSSLPQDPMNDMAKSILSVGVLEPLIVRRSQREGFYEVVAGERRLTAAVQINLDSVPCLVKELSDAEVMVIALTENIQRQDMNPIDEAEAMMTLVEDHKCSQEYLAQLLGISQSSISHSLRLLRLPPDIKNMILANQLSSGHGKVLLKIKNDSSRLKLAYQVLEQKFSVRQLESVISGNQPKKTSHHKVLGSYPRKKIFFVKKIRIEFCESCADKGFIRICYNSNDQKENIVSMMRKASLITK